MQLLSGTALVSGIHTVIDLGVLSSNKVPPDLSLWGFNLIDLV